MHIESGPPDTATNTFSPPDSKPYSLMKLLMRFSRVLLLEGKLFLL